MPENTARNRTRPVPPIRAERKGRCWTVATMARRLRDAGTDDHPDPAAAARAIAAHIAQALTAASPGQPAAPARPAGQTAP